jgi:hypothetical protein
MGWQSGSSSKSIWQASVRSWVQTTVLPKNKTKQKSKTLKTCQPIAKSTLSSKPQLKRKQLRTKLRPLWKGTQEQDSGGLSSS